MVMKMITPHSDKVGITATTSIDPSLPATSRGSPSGSVATKSLKTKSVGPAWASDLISKEMVAALPYWIKFWFIKNCC